MNLSNLICPPQVAVSPRAELAQEMAEPVVTGRNTDERRNTRVPGLCFQTAEQEDAFD